MKKALLVLIMAAFAVTLYAGDPVEVWNEVYDTGDHNMAQGVAVDVSGNVYVGGFAQIDGDNDYLVIKYNPDGDTLWTRTFDDGNGHDNIYGIAVDVSSNVYVTGMSNSGTDIDWRTIKYDTEGNELLSVPYDGGSGDDWASCVAADEAGNFYVSGRTDNGTDNDWRVIKYDSEGNIVWNEVFDEGNDDDAYGVAVDETGNVYVTGFTDNGANRDFRTIKYDSEGSIVWNEVFDGDSTDFGYRIAVDEAGYVYASGSTHNGTDFDWLIVKYDASGNTEWSQVAGGDGTDWGRGIAVDAYFVYVTGGFNNGTDEDFRTIRYDKEGGIGWDKVFDSGNNESSSGVAVDDSGYVCVTGWFNNGNDWDFRTIKYEQDDYPIALSEQPPPSSLTLEVVENLSSVPTLNYSLPVGISATLTFYSADGRKIESYNLNPAQSDFTWDALNVPTGVYFARLRTGTQTACAKLVLTR